MTGLFGFFATADRSPSPPAAAPGRRIVATPRGWVAVDPGPTPVALVERHGLVIAAGGMPARVESQGAEASLEAAATAFLDDYRKRGTAAFSDHAAPCTFALCDPGARRLALVTDRMGIGTLFFTAGDGEIGFASSAAIAARLHHQPPRLSLQALFDYMYFHVVPAPVSIFESVERLGPGECLVAEAGGTRRSAVWTPKFDERFVLEFPALKREFHDVLTAAVADAAGQRAAAFLSGGTDSSTIAGLLGKVGGEPAQTYSIGFAAEGYDEMEYARIASRHFGTRHHEYYVTPEDVVAAIPELARIHDQPFGNASAIPTYYCARLAAADGAQSMLGGDGGDELFGGNARYATQHVLSLYERIPAPLRRGIVEPVALRLPSGVPPLRKLRSYVEQARVPMPARTETYNLLRRFGYAQIFAPGLIERLDTDEPLRLQSAAYFNPSAKSLINRQLALDLKFTLADNDLRKVVRSCELAGLPVSFPMLDRRVVDFSLRLAPELKLRGTTLRYFFKEALRDFLPEEILRKEKHGFGLPFGLWAVSHRQLRELAFDSIANLAGRGFFRRTWLDSLPAHLEAHPPFYGTMVWVLMMLEQWLQHHAPATRFSS